MKKILFVIESLSGGGAEKILVDLLKNLDRSKYDITVLAISETGIYTEQVKQLCHYQKILPDYSTIKKTFGKIFYRIQYNLVYSLPVGIIVSLYMKSKFDVEIAFVEGYVTKLVSASRHKNEKIAWVHTDFKENHWTSQVYKSLDKEKEVYRRFSRILCVSRKVHDSFIEVIGTKEKVAVQYNPLDTNEVKIRASESLNLPHKMFRFITVGRLVEQKGYDRLIEIVNRLKNEGYFFEILILGEGPDRIKLKNQISKYNLENYILLLGFQNNPYKYMKQSDMFLCSSRAEGFSTVATEALILGLPILTTDCAGMKELFGAYNCGIITPNSDEGLYLGIKRVLSDIKSLKLFEEDVQKRAEEFDVRKRIEEIEGVFDEKNNDYE